MFGNDARSYFYLAEALLIVSTIAMRRLVSSDFGFSLVALRDFESYAVSRGIPATRQRVLAIVASSIFTSLAGSIYAHYLMVASPDVFSFSLSTLLLSMVLVGGSATIYGPIVAAVVLTVGTEELADLGVVRYMVVAVLIVLTMRFLPGGVWSYDRSACAGGAPVPSGARFRWAEKSRRPDGLRSSERAKAGLSGAQRIASLPIHERIGLLPFGRILAKCREPHPLARLEALDSRSKSEMRCPRPINSGCIVSV